MLVALQSTFAASRKEPLAEVMDRVRQAFLDSSLGEPKILFNFGDHLVAAFVSSVDRVLKRHPELGRFVTEADPAPGIRGARRISNGPLSPAAGEAVPYPTLRAIAAGVPRSFPFHSVALHFAADAFGRPEPRPPGLAEMMPGVLLTDAWWVNGRARSLSACTIVDAEPTGKKLPPLPQPVAALLAGCGKVRRTVQIPLPTPLEAGPAIPVRAPSGFLLPSANPAAARAVAPIVADHRARLAQIVERAALPHDLPASRVVLRQSLGVKSGPRKPALVRVFGAMGYSCKGSSGTFTLQRRTGTNLTVDITLDVGTWGHSVLGIYKVLGVGFKATLILPVSAAEAAGGQYPIGDEAHWNQIVENLGALVAELDRTFVPEIERAAGPSPDWYQPDS